MIKSTALSKLVKANTDTETGVIDWTEVSKVLSEKHDTIQETNVSKAIAKAEAKMDLGIPKDEVKTQIAEAVKQAKESSTADLFGKLGFEGKTEDFVKAYKESTDKLTKLSETEKTNELKAFFKESGVNPSMMDKALKLIDFNQKTEEGKDISREDIMKSVKEDKTNSFLFGKEKVIHSAAPSGGSENITEDQKTINAFMAAME